MTALAAAHPDVKGAKGKTRKERKKRKIALQLLMLAVVLLVMARMMLPLWVTNYVNRVLDNLDGYSGQISDVDIHLWRGAYSIHDIRILKDGAGGPPVPFLRMPTMDLSVEWRALLHGSVVAEVAFFQPELNFAVSKSGKGQTGQGAHWTQALDKLVPVEVNLMTVHNGAVTYQDFSAAPKIDLFIRDIDAQVHNLRNVEDKSMVLPSPFRASGTSIGKGKLTADGNVNILKKIPDADLNLKLVSADLMAVNDYTRHYAGIDFAQGTLDLYIEMAVKNGYMTGYLKPIANNIRFIDIAHQDKNPLDIIWESFAAAFVGVFKNHPKDQFATKVPLEGSLTDPEANMWRAFTGIFRNAFIQAFSRDIDGTISFGKIGENKAEVKKESKTTEPVREGAGPAEQLNQRVIKR